MALQVCNGAALKCAFGVAPSVLIVLPINRVLTSNQPAANILDHKPLVNIQPFGMCSCLSNPTVAAATAAALGVLTPQPCIPATTLPWAPGSPTVMIANMPALNNTSTLQCLYGGVISVLQAGQVSHQIP